MKIYKNDTTEIYATDEYNRVTLGVHSLQMPDTRAMYAMDLMKTMAPMLMLDTHPNATRMSPAEAAKAVAEVAAAAFAEFESRNWLVETPSMAVLREEARENRGRN